MREGSRPPLAALLPALWLLLLVGGPLLVVLGVSISVRDPAGGVRGGLSLEGWRTVVDPLTLRILGRSAAIAAASTALSVAVAFPVAAHAAFAPRRVKAALLALVVLPFCTNLMVRLYALGSLLGEAGLVNRLLVATGVPGAPFALGGSAVAVQLGLLYSNLPFAILPIFAVLDRLDPALLEAAMDLGASRARVFRDVVLPAALPGLLSAVAFCFVPTLGAFAVPQLLGGPDDLMIGNVVTSAFLDGRDWPFGSALGATLLLLSAVFVALRLRSGRDGVVPAIPGGPG